MKTCHGKAIVVFSLMLIAGLIGAEYADALKSSAGQLLPVEGDATLTVIFGPPPDVFDPSAGAGVPVFDVKDVTFEEGEMVGVGFAEGNGPAVSVSLMASVPQDGSAGPIIVNTIAPPGGDPGTVPEPSTLLLLGLGMLALLGLAKRKAKVR